MVSDEMLGFISFCPTYGPGDPHHHLGVQPPPVVLELRHNGLAGAELLGQLGQLGLGQAAACALSRTGIVGQESL
jgi:hypothetical protein